MVCGKEISFNNVLLLFLQENKFTGSFHSLVRRNHILSNEWWACLGFQQSLRHQSILSNQECASPILSPIHSQWKQERFRRYKDWLIVPHSFRHSSFPRLVRKENPIYHPKIPWKSTSPLLWPYRHRSSGRGPPNNPPTTASAAARVMSPPPVCRREEGGVRPSRGAECVRGGGRKSGERW